MNKPHASDRAPNIIFIQPALPAYRLDFFKRLSAALGPRFHMHYSPGDLGALTRSEQKFDWERRLPPMRWLLPGVLWQPGVLKIPLRRGDQMIVCGNPRELSMLLLLLKAHCSGVYTIWFGNYWIYSSTKLRFSLRMLLMKMSDAVLFYTDLETEQYYAGIGKNDTRLISAVNNGIDVEPIKQRRIAYTAESRPRDLMFVGRLQLKTGLDILIRALASPAMQGINLNVIGDGEQRDALMAQAIEAGVANRIFWHGATVDETKIAKIMNQSRLFVYPGPVGLSLLHAMAYGLPAVVSTDEALSNAELAAFKDGETGRSFLYGDPAHLAETIASVIDDNILLQSWSREAVRLTTETFNTEKMAERVLDILGRTKAP